MSKERVAVVFKEKWRAWNAGETAGFNTETAEYLIENGIAVFDEDSDVDVDPDE